MAMINRNNNGCEQNEGRLLPLGSVVRLERQGEPMVIFGRNIVHMNNLNTLFSYVDFPRVVKRYLEMSGWREVPVKIDYMAVYQLENGDVFTQVNIPIDKELRDFYNAARRAVMLISEANQITESALVRTLCGMIDDVIDEVIYDYVAVPWNNGIGWDEDSARSMFGHEEILEVLHIGATKI